MKYIFVFLLSIWSLSTIQAQDSLGVPKDYLYKALEIGMSPVTVAEFYNAGVDVTKNVEYLAIGIDLKKLSKYVSPVFMKSLLLANTKVVVGQITKREYNPDVKARFHTTFTLKVTKKVRGENVPSEIKIKQASGFVGDKFMSISVEPRVHIGETVVLITDPISLSNVFKLEEDYYKSKNRAEEAMYSDKADIDENTYLALHIENLKGNELSNKCDNEKKNIEVIAGVVKKIDELRIKK